MSIQERSPTRAPLDLMFDLVDNEQGNDFWWLDDLEFFFPKSTIASTTKDNPIDMASTKDTNADVAITKNKPMDITIIRFLTNKFLKREIMIL